MLKLAQNEFVPLCSFLMLLVNQIAEFFHHKYLQKEKILFVYGIKIDEWKII